MGLFSRIDERQSLLDDEGLSADDFSGTKKAMRIRKSKLQQSRASQKEFKLKQKRQARNVRSFRQGVKEFGGAANPVPMRLTQAQEDMKELFGGGEKIWGNVQEPVRINNDLNPRQRGDEETGRMFGF